VFEATTGFGSAVRVAFATFRFDPCRALTLLPFDFAFTLMVGVGFASATAV
jgi:hypothetical protein